VIGAVLFPHFVREAGLVIGAVLFPHFVREAGGGRARLSSAS